MYVKTSDAFGFSRLEKSFGVPTATSGMVELFGMYCGGDHWCFWSYNPDTQIWVRHALDNRTPEFEGITLQERKSFRTAQEQLTELSAPPLPSDRSTVRRETPFLYMGFTFQWLFIPQLNRWELLPLGRHDTLTAQR